MATNRAGSFPGARATALSSSTSRWPSTTGSATRRPASERISRPAPVENDAWTTGTSAAPSATDSASITSVAHSGASRTTAAPAATRTPASGSDRLGWIAARSDAAPWRPR